MYTIQIAVCDGNVNELFNMMRLINECAARIRKVERLVSLISTKKRVAGSECSDLAALL